MVVNARQSAKAADAVVETIAAAGGRAVAALGDVTDPAFVDRLIGTAVDRFGGVDLLINNAAVRSETPFDQLDFAEWREVLSIILDGAYLTSRAALPHLSRSGRGAIVNIGGLSAHTGAAGRAHVVTAKAGLAGLTRALAHDLAPRDITVNCVAPGMIDTVRERTAARDPSHHARHQPLRGQRGAPEDIAGCVRYLCGPAARYITGQTIHVNGGIFMA